jgi:UDP-glucose 4-epimerase
MVPTPENVPLVIPDLSNPRYSYGGSKITSELALYHYCKFKDLDLQIIRPHNIYGSDMGEEHVIPEIALKLQSAIDNNRQIIDLQGSGDESRSFCYIEDFIQGFELISHLPFNNCQEVYNVGTDEEVKISKLVKLMTSKFGIDINYNYLPSPQGGTLRRCPDISKLKSIGFASQYDLDLGLNLYLDWFKKSKH